jgi:cell division protease FtsH
MFDFMIAFGGALSAFLAVCAGASIYNWCRSRFVGTTIPVAKLVRSHFAPVSVDKLTISERRFPFRVRADLQRAVDRLFAVGTTIRHFSGVTNNHPFGEISLSDCTSRGGCYESSCVPAQHEEINIGENNPVRCLKNGLWLLDDGQNKCVVVFSPTSPYGDNPGIQFQIGVVTGPDGERVTQTFFKHLENAVLKSESYRGKILSLDALPNSYTGAATGITVHKLRAVERDQVILPRKTLDLLDRNVVQFVRQRPQLARFHQATKKGILFYGPPGTGKTHTIHYLARALEGHTTLLISAEQVALLSDYMTLARLLQPSIVVIEDVDLIGRERTSMNSPCEEALLNKLLNEMDGLKEDADILFILSTNRPEVLEPALASRPGRIDQAIEFPLPDDEGREKLMRLYSQKLEVPDDLARAIVARTEKVSAAFIKELMRRSVEFHLESNGTDRIELADVEKALDEMLFSGGSLNLKLLGAEGIHGKSARVGF